MSHLYELDDRIKALLMTDPSFLKMRQESIADSFEKATARSVRQTDTGQQYPFSAEPANVCSRVVFRPTVSRMVNFHLNFDYLLYSIT
jgi:hypothetical protein